MGEVLPPKRQTVVDRLRRRFEIYRRHQGSCSPRYDQAANGIYDAQRHDTLLMKQRLLEAKAKKTKRSDNRHTAQRDNTLNNSVTNNNTNNNAGSNNCDSKTSLVTQSKLKRAAGSPLLDCAIDGLGDGHSNKIPRNSTADHPSNSNHHHQQQQQQQQQSGMPSFSVQIVQQFTSSNTSKSPHSQTIQTNVTVQALSGGQIKTSNSPMTNTTASPGVQSGDAGANVRSNNSGTPGTPSTSISVGTSIECKQEPPENNFAPCSLAGNRTINNNNLNSELSNNNNNGNSNLGTTQTTMPAFGDRFSDSLANLGFPEDSSDDVIHPDILKDIIDDVFTNPSDLMNGFNFVDNLKDNGGGNFVDDKETSPSSLRNVLGSNKAFTNNTSSAPMNHFQNNMGATQFSLSQSQQSVFDFHSGGVNNAANVNTSQSFPQTRMSTYATTSPNMNTMNNNAANNNGLGLDFKLTEPSPAAQTLKQMAEQHQNMQQKQQQLGHLHPRSPFGSDSFPDPLSNIRPNFLNGSPTSIMQKSPNSLFQSMGFNNANNNQQQVFQGNASVKQEVGSPVPPMYTSMNSPPVQLADLEQLHKRRQAMQMQQQRPPFSQSPDQKPMGINQNSGPTAYMATRPLSHYNDSLSMGSVPSHGSASNSPVSHSGQFMRGVTTPGVTPPPPQNFVSSPSSGGALHLSQSQQLQISQSGQQLQVSQSQQQLLMNQDMKPNMSPQTQHQQQQQQQQHVQARNFYPGHHSSVHMSQSQSVSFQFGGNSGACSPNTAQRTQQVPPTHTTATPASQRPMQQQYAGRPPPDYQSPLETNSMNHGQQHHPQQPPPMNHQADTVRVVNQGQRGRKNLQSSQPYMAAQTHMEHAMPPHSSNNTLLMSRTTPPPSVNTTTRGRGGKSNSRSNSSTNRQGYPRLQRPPNVNVGPEGLNISQRPPGMSTDWRHVFMQQQQQQQLNTNPVRIPYSRATLPNNYVQNTGVATYPNSGAVQVDPNSNVLSGSGAMSRTDHLMANNISQMGGVPTGNVQFLMQQQQQQQAMIQSGLNVNPNSLLTTAQMQMTTAAGSLSVRDGNQHHQNLFSSDLKPPPPSGKLDDLSQNITDNNQFILDFLDNLDPTSDLLNFDMSANSSFPLLEDMSKMLGQ